MKTRMLVQVLMSWAFVASLVGLASADESKERIDWQLDNLKSVGGHPVTVVGEPVVIETPDGKAIEFDGVDDALFFDVHPLAGWTAFTVEIIFLPATEGPPEQRFFHMQEKGSESRVMFETRVVDGDRWFLDTFINTGRDKVALYAEDHRHPTGKWHHAALVVGERRFRHYVNGELELEEELDYRVQQDGKTSIGVRINRVDWFKGAIRTIRFTPRPLAPEAFIGVEG